MEAQQGKRVQAFSIVFTMLLFLVFVLSALFTILIGSRVYENITVRAEDNYAGSVILGYISNKVRQGDEMGMVTLEEIEGQTVLQLSRVIDEEQYVTWIYYHEGYIKELFTDTASGLGLGDGIEIIECQGLRMEQRAGLLYFETEGQGGSSVSLAPRSKGAGHE